MREGAGGAGVNPGIFHFYKVQGLLDGLETESRARINKLFLAGLVAVARGGS